MHDTLRGLHGGRRASGTTLDHFRLNEAVSQIAFGGRRGRVYRRIVALAGARPGDCVLDVGCSGGYLARKLADAVGPAGRVVGVDPSATAIAYAQRHAGPGMSFTTGAAQDLPCWTPRSRLSPARSRCTTFQRASGRMRSPRCTV